MTETSAKKDVQKLQRTVVDALEDVKAQDLVVFDTEHLSSLFERVIVASGTSNRQTKALAASVRDKVREAGFGKPRIGGARHAAHHPWLLQPRRNLGRKACALEVWCAKACQSGRA
jgi:ribosomal silencing factor RsfS